MAVAVFALSESIPAEAEKIYASAIVPNFSDGMPSLSTDTPISRGA